jgi:hypothetical protein
VSRICSVSSVRLLTARRRRQLGGVPDRPAVQPEDRRRERRRDRGQVDRIRQIGDLDLDPADLRLARNGQAGDHRVDLLLELGRRDHHRAGQLAGRELVSARQLGLGGPGIAELLERESEHLVGVGIVGLDPERLLQHRLGLGEPRQVEQRHALLVQRVAPSGRDPQRRGDPAQRLVAAAEVVERLGLEHGEIGDQRRVAPAPRLGLAAAALGELQAEPERVAAALALAVDVEVRDRAQGLGVVGIERERELVGQLRLLIAAERGQRGAPQVLGLDRGRRQIARAIGAGPRRGVLRALDLLVGLVEQRRHPGLVVGVVRDRRRALDHRLLVMRPHHGGALDQRTGLGRRDRGRRRRTGGRARRPMPDLLRGRRAVARRERGGENEEGAHRAKDTGRGG